MTTSSTAPLRVVPALPCRPREHLFNGSINVVFENTTPYAMIMNSYVEGGYLYVDIWSTQYFTVKTQASDKTNFTQPHDVENDAEDCEPRATASQGSPSPTRAGSTLRTSSSRSARGSGPIAGQRHSAAPVDATEPGRRQGNFSAI